jgi:transcriptional regulator GlxA family with amidase domain
LRETELPIKTVVSLAGFGSAENMRRIFLSETRCSPADYRRLHASPRRI